MKPKHIVIGIVIAVCVGVGAYLGFKYHSAAPLPGGEESSAPTVVSVQTGTLKRMTLHHYVTGYGTVEPAPATADAAAADAPLAAPSAGVVASVKVAEGQRVRQGQVLMTLNSSTATADYAEQEVARQKRLFSEHNTSLKNLQAAGAQLAALQVVAPLSGTVVSLNVKPGAAVDASTVVAEVMDLSRLVVKTDIPAAQADELKAGQEMEVLTRLPVTAPVSYISPTVNTNTGTVGVWAALPANSGLRPGQFVSLQIVTAVHTNCLAAPEASVVTDESGHSVISLVQGGQAIRTPVTVGFHENGWMEIAGNGLRAGDTVVTVGAYGLPAKTQIRVVNP